MYQMMLRARNKKGFTLVEVIVVLVILAILAAILIPSMIGWINKAEDKSAIVEARTCLLAAQTIVSENYKTYTGASAATALTAAHVLEANALADVGATITASVVADGQVTGLTITSSGSKTVVFSDGADPEYTVS